MGELRGLRKGGSRVFCRGQGACDPWLRCSPWALWRGRVRSGEPAATGVVHHHHGGTEVTLPCHLQNYPPRTSLPTPSRLGKGPSMFSQPRKGSRHGFRAPLGPMLFSDLGKIAPVHFCLLGCCCRWMLAALL